ncbi:MAG: hypothetical protein KJ556_20305 [Gammaproteobacteria bacterium]|nr:hypothetical protein [Gammaproteobacteria bacterium]
MKRTLELLNNQRVLVLYRSDGIVSHINGPVGAAVGEVIDGIEVGEGPYAIINSSKYGHSQEFISTQLLLHGKSLEQAMENLGLAEETLIPRFS